MLDRAESNSVSKQSAIEYLRNLVSKVLAWVLAWQLRPLLIILCVEAFVSVATLRNTAFQDEALYLYAGQQIFRYLTGGPAPLENYAFYFSGYPYAYPLLGGVLNMIGGLEFARSFSLLCMLGVNAILYFSTRRLFQTDVAIFASASYAFLGSVLFIGRLATFDAMCLFLIALATAVAYKSSFSKRLWWPVLLGPLVVLAILTKYAALLLGLPVFFILVAMSLSNRGWWRMGIRLSLAVVSLAISIIVTYRFMDKSAFHAINGSTTDRTALILESRQNICIHVVQMGGVVYAAAILGLALVFRYQRHLRLLALTLFASSLLAPAYHIYKMEAVSLDKHIAYSLFYAAPLAGYALVWLSNNMRHNLSDLSKMGGWSWMTGMAVVLIIFCLGLQQSQAIYAQWANTSSLSYVLHTQMRDGSGRFLIEDIEVIRYDDEDITQPWQWNGLQYFYYVNSDHQALLGYPALAQAIADRYFAIVELSFNAHPIEARFAAEQMALSGNYDLIATVPFQNSFGTGHFYIFRSALAPGQGDFTDIAQVIP